MTKWPIRDAKSRFSELVACAETEGPQIITRRGREQAVLMSMEDFRKLQVGRPDFRDYLLSGPKFDDFEVERSKDSGRPVDL
mgnify:CR=1 FL=1